MPFTVTLEWSSRSQALQKRLSQKVTGVSFWLTPAIPPAQFGAIAPALIGTWATAPTTALVVTTDPAKQTATVTIPDGTTNVRLDFNLIGTASGHTAAVLTFRQLFAVTAVKQPGQPGSGTLLPTQFAIDDVILTPTAAGPNRTKGSSPTGFKVQAGSHPLLRLSTPGNLSVNAEFVDVTELWWLTHPDTTWGWYWRPELKGRQEHLRVLAWTGGGNPMIWFVAVPDAAVRSSGQPSKPPPPPSAGSSTPGDIVFFRPPPGSNSFVYGPTQAGFEAKNHDDITLVNLARYLLSPIAAKDAVALKTGGLRSAELLADQVQPKATSPAIQPRDPMTMMTLLDPTTKRTRPEAFTDGRANAFRPVGLEAAVNRVATGHILFVPLGFDATKANSMGGYEAAKMSDLKNSLQSALNLLWTVNAIGRDKSTPPRTQSRELWIAGHSSGNRSAWVCVDNNGADVDRVLSFDSDTLAAGIKSMAAAGIKRPKNKPIHAFVIMTPSNGGPTGLTATQDQDLRKLRSSQVLVTALPDFSARAAYWHLTPPPITNPFLLYLLSQWNVPAKTGSPQTLLDISATTPGNWGFLFFHELAVFGGDLVRPAAPFGTASPPPSFVRTFFEQALGSPNPRPPYP